MLNNIHLNPFAISNLLIIFTCFPLAFFAFVTRRNKLQSIYSLVCFSVGTWGLGGLIASTTSNPSISLIFWKLGYSGVIFIPIFFAHVASLLVIKKASFFLLLAYLQGLFFLLLNIFGILFTSIKFMHNSFYVAQGGILYFFSFLFWIIIVFNYHFILIKFYISNKDKQTFLFALSGFTGFCGGLTNFLQVFGLNVYPVGNFVIPLYVLIMTYGILKYQILGLNMVVQKGFIYSILIALITGIYFIFVLLAEHLFKGAIGYQSLLVSTFYAFVITLLFNPLKNKIQHIADRIFLGKDPIQIAQENELLKQELEKSERLKAIAALASGMAHEIKNPLTALKTFAEYLPEKIKDPEFLAKFSKIVSTEVGRIDNLVHQLLEFAKPSPLKLEEVDIHKLLDDTLEFLSNDFIKHNIKVVKIFDANTRESVDADLRGLSNAPACRQGRDGRGLDIRGNPHEIRGNLRLKVDSNRIRQAFLNLFLNAIDAMPSGGTLTISTSISVNPRQEKSAVISVQDTGIGIPDKLLPHIFEPFHSTKEKGTGLGLSITYGILKEHKGEIRVDSKINEGTIFTIELPITDHAKEK